MASVAWCVRVAEAQAVLVVRDVREMWLRVPLSPETSLPRIAGIPRIIKTNLTSHVSCLLASVLSTRSVARLA